MSTQIEQLLKKIDNDAKILRFDESFCKFSHFNLPIKALQNETETLHRMRLMRTLKTQGSDFVARIVDASMADQAARSRLTEITLQAFKAEKVLITTLESLKDHLLVTYNDDLRIFKTKEERLRIVDIALSRYQKYLNDVTRIQNMVAIVVKDIDQGAWTIKSILEALKLMSQREMVV
jgi:hypothetical protein